MLDEGRYEEVLDPDKSEAHAEHQRATGELEGKLSSALEQTSALQFQLTALSKTHTEALAFHKAELASLTRSHGASLAQRDARIAELRAEVDRVSASLREAHEAVQKLRADNARLAGEKTEVER
ncbi:hypothetical protein VTG60DRAFT_665 [Thermothelomyces hinnuleus]